MMSSSTATSTSGAASPSSTLAYTSSNPNYPLWEPNQNPPLSSIEPIRGSSLGATMMGPHNYPVEIQNPDLLAPPSTDSGSVSNAKWPFALSHNRLQAGGWARQQNVAVMPIASAMAGVNMRLEAGAIRELHWHKTAEWAYILAGSVIVTAVNAAGQNFMSEVNAGDLWYFPPGVPHSLQATDSDPAGSEFLLVFDSGAFSEDSTFLLSDWLSHIPKEVLAKNFQVNVSSFDHIPAQQLYIFPAPVPKGEILPTSPYGTAPVPYTFPFSQYNATQLSGGTVKIVDSSIFKISTTIAVAEVTVEPGAMRELHWHPTQDEWSFFIEGQARITLFANNGNARTFSYEAGDVGYVPATFGHYVENTGNTTLRFLEIFASDRFEDISLSQWLALVPSELVKEHLQISDATLAHFSKSKPIVIGPA